MSEKEFNLSYEIWYSSLTETPNLEVKDVKEFIKRLKK